MKWLVNFAYFFTVTTIISGLPSRDNRRPRRDITFGKHLNPLGGWTNNVRYENDYFHGQITQDYNRRGQSGPKQYLLGGKYDPNEYYEVFYGLDEIPHYEKRKVRLGVQAHVPVGNNNQVGAFVQHSKTTNTNFQRQSETNTAAISWQHNSGASLSAVASKTPGQSNVLSVSGGVPLYQGDNMRVDVQGSRTYVSGNKPSDQVGVQVQGKF